MNEQDQRTILHVDMNSFYASVEQAEHPELRGVPLVVAGKEELRHGIVLTKSLEAKPYGIKTGEALWEARKKCPGLLVLPPHYKLYKNYSRMAQDIYYQYTDRVEPFGLDECWLDLGGTENLHGKNVMRIAREISERMKAELGLTVSIGVSWNKIFAKFGSDYKKPDAITPITRENYREIVWNAPVRDLLYVGPATERKLLASAYNTIGDLAQASDYYLKHRFGKIGFMLRAFARGEDRTPVKAFDPKRHNVDRVIKSVGNGLTAPHNIESRSDAKALLWLLSESVAQRLREGHFRARTVSIGVRSQLDLSGYERQSPLCHPSAATRDIAQTAWMILEMSQPIDAEHPIRALHVRASNLIPVPADEQLCFFPDADLQQEHLDCAIDDLRRRFGNKCIIRGCELVDESLRDLDIKSENTVHPVGFLHS